MARPKAYEVTVNGRKVQLRLSDEDAKKYPDAKELGSVEDRRGGSQPSKSRSASTKKADPPANKSGS